MDNPAGWIASAFTLATFVCCQGRPLRLCALAANVAFIVYGATAHLWPVLVLHAILVPINLWRLSQLRGQPPAGRVAPSCDDNRSRPRLDPVSAQAEGPRLPRSTLLQGAGYRKVLELILAFPFAVVRLGVSRFGLPLALVALLAPAACGGGEAVVVADSGTASLPLAGDGSVLPSPARAWPADRGVRTVGR